MQFFLKNGEKYIFKSMAEKYTKAVDSNKKQNLLYL